MFAYELELQIDRDQEILRGLQKMHLRCTGDRLATVSFPRNGIEVLKVTSGGHALPVATRNSRFEIRLAAPLAQGEEVSLELAYSAARPKGVVFQPDAVYTSFHTCHWMVCRDRPDDKATFRLAIDVPEGLSLVASGAPIGEPKADGTPGRQVWLERVPSSPYLFGFALGRFARTARQHRGVTLEYFASKADGPKLRQMFADDERMLDFFVQKAGRPLPRATYRQVVVEGDAAPRRRARSRSLAAITSRCARPTLRRTGSWRTRWRISSGVTPSPAPTGRTSG